MGDSNDYQFKVMACAAVTVVVGIDVNANDSFDDAQRLAENAVSEWFRKLFREYAPQQWPSPRLHSMAVEVVEITGNWTKGDNSDDNKQNTSNT